MIRRSKGWWLWLALACLALTVAVSGAAGTDVVSTAPAYGIVSPANNNSASPTLVRIDPRTLSPLAGGLAIPAPFAFGSRSPDGRSAVLFSFQRGSLRIVDLEKLRNRGEIVVAPSGWQARATAWLTADRVAAVVQKMRGAYNQIVDQRQVVIVDPFARRVVARQPIAAGMALNTSASGGDKIVLLLGRGDARTRTAQVVVVDSAGNAKTVDLDLGAPRGLRLPSLVVSPSGERAFVVASDAPVFEIDLNTLQATPHALAGGAAAVLATSSGGSRQALLLDNGTLAVTGRNTGHDKGLETSSAAGFALVNTSTWQSRLVNRDVSGLSVSGDTLLGYSYRIERILHKGRAIQRASGIGLRAYAANGSQRWQRYGNQPLSAQAFRGSAYVHRAASPPIGWGGNFVVGLAAGDKIRDEKIPGQGLFLLPDVPDAPPVPSPSTASAPALEIEGTGESFSGTAQPQVTRVVVSLVDGSDRDLTLDAGTVSYQAASPNENARTVQAFAGDQLVTSITLAVACGGGMGPCPSVAPLSTTTSSTTPTDSAAPATTAPGNQESTNAVPTYAFFGELPSGGATLARVDPRTLNAVGPSLRLTERYMPSFARSPVGSEVALAARDKPVVRIVDLASLRIVRTLQLGSAGDEAHALAWLDDSRLVAVAQRMSQPTRRYVRAREAVTFDPTTGWVVARKPLTNKLALNGVATGGNRLVIMLRSSLGKGSTAEIAVVEASGAVRTRQVEVGTTGGALNGVSLAVEPSGKRAFLLQAAIRRATPPVIEINLDTLATTSHSVRAEERAAGPATVVTVPAPAASVDDRYIVVAGAVGASARIDGIQVPAAGLFSIDTQSWIAKRIDDRASHFEILDGRVISFGPSSATNRQGRPLGAGVSITEPGSSLRSHLYGVRTFQQVELAGDYGHILRGDLQSAKRLVFDVRTGKSLGTLPALARPVEVIPAPTHLSTSGAPPVPGGRAPAVARANPNPFATVSNRGTRVQPKATTREREYTPQDVFLLRRAEGRAVYRIGGLQPGFSSCFASGFGNDIGRVGSIGCNPGFPSQHEPVLNMSVTHVPKGGKAQLFRLEGVAADGVAAIGLMDSKRNVIQRVPVEDNVYMLAHPPAAATGEYVAYDSQGKIVFRTDQRARPATPAAPASSRKLAGFRIKMTLPKGWTGVIHQSGAGSARAALFANTTVVAPNPRSAYVSLVERDPRERPAYSTISSAPQIALSDIRAGDVGRARAERKFTLHGRQFQLLVGLDRSRATPIQLRGINRMLATLTVGAIAVQAVPSGTALQHAGADGVTVDVYRSGAVIFHFDPASRLYEEMQGKNASVACLTFDSTNPWESNEAWSSVGRLAETKQVLFGAATQHRLPYATLAHPTEAEPPFDGCLVSGSYGRRWNDPRGQRSPAEIAFTPTGRRFFDERAVARDLGLFVRSTKLAAARRELKNGGNVPAATTLIHGLPDRVVALTIRDQTPAAGKIGVWTNEDDTIEVSARSTAGKRLYIELRNGRIARHNLHGLATVF